MKLLPDIRYLKRLWFRIGYAAGFDDGIVNGRIREREGR